MDGKIQCTEILAEKSDGKGGLHLKLFLMAQIAPLTIAPSPIALVS